MKCLTCWTGIAGIMALTAGLGPGHPALGPPARRPGWTRTSPGVAGSAPRPAAAGATRLSAQTSANLNRAMRGEATAYVRYLLDAEVARRSGNAALARLFENTARTERLEHFREEAKMAGLVGDNRKNLEDAIRGETYEATQMYPEFARQARAAGDTAVAGRLAEIARDEARHRAAFEAALRQLGDAAGGRAHRYK